MRKGTYPFVLAVLVISVSSRAAEAPSVPLGGDYWKDTAPSEGVWGFADLHAHFFTDLAYGGRVIHGKAHAPGGMPEALHGCGHNHGQDSKGFSTAFTLEGKHHTSGYPTFEGWPRHDSFFHQQAYVDWIRRAWQGGLRVVQMDVQNTAFLGKAFARINRGTLEGNPKPLPIDDASAVGIQVAAARALFESGPAADFAAIATSADEARRIIESGKLAVILGIEVEAIGNYLTRKRLGPNPRETIAAAVRELHEAGIRHVIPIHLTRNAFGHPAVSQRVLNAMNFAETGRWYVTRDGFDQGIRFTLEKTPSDPISVLVESLGWLMGSTPESAARADMAAEGLTPEGEWLVEELFRAGMIVDIEHMSDLAKDRVLDLAEARGVPVMASHTNLRDLSFGTRVSYGPAGEYLATQPDAPYSEETAAIYGTSDPRRVANERGLSLAHLRRIRALGGMLGLAFPSQVNGYSWRGVVPNDCDGTSKTFAQDLLYATELLGGRGVAIGSDVSGFASLPGPRFGPNGCYGSAADRLRAGEGRARAQALAQTGGVRYDSPVTSAYRMRFEQRGPRETLRYSRKEADAWWLLARERAQSEPVPGSVDAASRRVVEGAWDAMESGVNAPLVRSRAGLREFDVNLDGVAHYGLVPDFLQDVANVLRDHAGSADALKPVFRGAEDYLRMWERIEARR